MKDNTTGLYKIGKSKNPEYREKTLQSEKPTIKMIKVFESDIESDLHKEFADVRVRGEWFKLNRVQRRFQSMEESGKSFTKEIGEGSIFDALIVTVSFI
jgi:hypothetical protein